MTGVQTCALPICARLLSSVFYMTSQGKYEIHLTVKSMKGRVIAVKELASLVGACTGRTMTPQMGERPLVGEEYCTVACVESARFHTLQGVAKIGKGCEKISGDTFLMTDLPEGKKGIALSDGMGSGEEACGCWILNSGPLEEQDLWMALNY